MIFQYFEDVVHYCSVFFVLKIVFIDSNYFEDVSSLFFNDSSIIFKMFLIIFHLLFNAFTCVSSFFIDFSMFLRCFSFFFIVLLGRFHAYSAYL